MVLFFSFTCLLLSSTSKLGTSNVVRANQPQVSTSHGSDTKVLQTTLSLTLMKRKNNVSADTILAGNLTWMGGCGLAWWLLSAQDLGNIKNVVITGMHLEASSEGSFHPSLIPIVRFMEITLDSSRESPRHAETDMKLGFCSPFTSYQICEMAILTFGTLWLDHRTEDDKSVAHSCTDPKFPILRYREDVEASGKVKSVAQSKQLQSVFFFIVDESFLGGTWLPPWNLSIQLQKMVEVWKPQHFRFPRSKVCECLAPMSAPHGELQLAFRF